MSVNKKSSKLAVLGELGAYPLFLKAVENTLKYEWHLKSNIKTNKTKPGKQLWCQGCVSRNVNIATQKPPIYLDNLCVEDL